jgi:diaminopimelate epimerase
MQPLFSKYSATGNDFALFDNRKNDLSFSEKDIEKLCHRKLGIGADGIVFVDKSEKYPFKMTYFNSDGKEAEMCGNGARSIAHFAHHVLQLSDIPSYEFETMNSVYKAMVKDDFVKLQMTEVKDEDVKDVSFTDNSFYINTGVPHLVIEVDDLDSVDVNTLGRDYRNHKNLAPEGANVNFIQVQDNQTFSIRTYERGVEAETLSCGTGVTASAISCFRKHGWTGEINVRAGGGDLSVELNSDLSEIFYCGKVDKIFSGVLS